MNRHDIQYSGIVLQKFDWVFSALHSSVIPDAALASGSCSLEQKGRTQETPGHWLLMFCYLPWMQTWQWWDSSVATITVGPGSSIAGSGQASEPPLPGPFRLGSRGVFLCASPQVSGCSHPPAVPLSLPLPHEPLVQGPSGSLCGYKGDFVFPDWHDTDSNLNSLLPFLWTLERQQLIVSEKTLAFLSAWALVHFSRTSTFNHEVLSTQSEMSEALAQHFYFLPPIQLRLW